MMSITCATSGKGRPKLSLPMGESQTNGVSAGGCVPLQRCFKWRDGSPPTWLALCGALIVQIGFGLYPVVVKKFAAQVKANPYVLTFYRGIGATIVLMFFSFVFERHFSLPKPRIILLFMLLGLVGIFGNQFSYITAVYYVGPDATSALQPMTAVFTPVILILTCSETLYLLLPHTWLKFAGVLLAVGGAIEVALTGEPDQELATDFGSGYDIMGSGNGTSPQGNQQAIGYLGSLLDTLLSAIAIVLQKRFIYSKPDCVWRAYPIAVTGYSFLFGTLYMGLFNLYYVATRQTQEFALPLASLFALVYAIFITSVLCYFFINWSNKHLSSTVLSAFWPVQILLTLIASFLLFGDLFAPWQYLGSCVLLFGLMLVLYGNHIDGRLAKGNSVVQLRHCCGGERKYHKLSTYTFSHDEMEESLEMHEQTLKPVGNRQRNHSDSAKLVSTEYDVASNPFPVPKESDSNADSDTDNDDDGDDRPSEYRPLMQAEDELYSSHRTNTTL